MHRFAGSFWLRVGVVALVAGLLLSGARAAEMLNADVELMFPFLPECRGGGVASYAGSTMQIEPGDAGVITLKGDSEPVQGAHVSAAGTFEAFFDALAAMSETAHLVQMFDSTVVRAHVSAAGAKGGKTTKRSADRAAVSRRKST